MTKQKNELVDLHVKIWKRQQDSINTKAFKENKSKAFIVREMLDKASPKKTK